LATLIFKILGLTDSSTAAALRWGDRLHRAAIAGDIPELKPAGG